MAFQAVPNTCQFTANFTGPDGIRPSFSVYSRNVIDDWDAVSMDEFADDLGDAIVADYLPVLSVDFTFVNVTARDLTVQFGRVIEHTPVNAAGTLASPSLPAEVALRATFYGSPGAAPSRGGIFLLPPAENQVVGSIVQAGPLAALQTAAEAIHNSMSGGAAAHVIVSRYNGTELGPEQPNGSRAMRPVKRDVAVTNTVPTVLVRSRVDSQKKRRPSE